MPKEELSLNQLAIGQVGVVKRIDGDTPVLKRLAEMGLLPGTRVQLTRRAPLRDPIEITLRGYALTLRVKDARHIYMSGGAPCDKSR